MTRPLVSVIIPCYNHSRFLSEAIESVIAQRHAPVETIVVDDGSADDSVEVAGRYRSVRCISQSNRGVAASRNRGIRESHGDYLVFLDADDRLRPEALEIGVRLLMDHPDCGFVFGRCSRIDETGSPLPAPEAWCTAADHYLWFLEGHSILMPAMVMFRRRAIERAGGFEETLAGSEDYRLYLEIARRMPVRCHDGVVADYRRHGGNVSLNFELMLLAALRALRSQRPHVMRRADHRAAYRRGIRAWRSAYGQLLLWDVGARIRRHDWRRAVRGLACLVRHYPAGLVIAVSGKVGRERLPRAR